MKRHSVAILLLSLSIPVFCSCQSTAVMPHNPFAETPSVYDSAREETISSEVDRMPPPAVSLPETTGESVPPRTETLFQESIHRPEYRQTSEGEKTRIVHLESRQENETTIRQVAFLEEQEGRPDEETGAEPRKTDRHGLTIDPSLTEQGARILAAHHEGQSFEGPWRPQANLGFWPQQEYLADGGDEGAGVYVEEDWTVRNLGIEDTVAHFDTLDGRTLVEPSNRVHIYAPRFGAVRKIESVLNSGQITALSGANNQVALNVDHGKEQLGFAAQETQTGYARTRSRLGGLDGLKGSAGAGTTQGLGGYSNFESAMLYSNLLKQRSVGSAELAYLAEGSASARGWQGSEGVKVGINTLAPMIASSEEGAESFFQIEEDQSKTSKLRLIKIASKKEAQPGEIIEFTLRFDNIGSELIGNVTILDNLTTRLEFLPGTALCSLKSGFVVQPNDVGSFTLRFEITDPMKSGDFGVIQFKCRVR